MSDIFAGFPPGGGGAVTYSTSPFTFWARNPSNNSIAWVLPGANKITVQSFFIPYNMSVTNINLYINGGDGSNNADVGIYDTSGNLKMHIGAQIINSTGWQVFAVTGGPVNLNAGEYLLAFTCVSSSNIRFTASGSTNDGVRGAYYFSTASSSSGGALPSTITVATSASITNASGQDLWPMFYLT